MIENTYSTNQHSSEDIEMLLLNSANGGQCFISVIPNVRAATCCSGSLQRKQTRDTDNQIYF